MRISLRQNLRVAKKYAKPFAILNAFAPPRMSADSRGAFYFDLGLFYIRIPKAANTTVVAILHEIQTGQVEDVDEIKDRIIRPSKLTWRQAIVSRSFFKFVFVRDPFDRLLSAWLQKAANGNNQAYAHIPGYGEYNREGFGKFVSYLANGGLYENKHWIPQHKLFVLPPNRLDFVGKVESFNKDMQHVLDSNGLRLPEGRSLDDLYPTDKAGKRTGAGTRKREFYGLAEVELTRELYTKDFELIGYSREPDWF